MSMWKRFFGKTRWKKQKYVIPVEIKVKLSRKKVQIYYVKFRTDVAVSVNVQTRVRLQVGHFSVPCSVNRRSGHIRVDILHVPVKRFAAQCLEQVFAVEE